jgi:GNAT superfamily N-acetyltransferase
MPEIAAEIQRLRQVAGVPSPLEMEQRHWFADRQWVFPEPLAEYPAHLHIDLLPRVRGQGRGRAMVTGLLEALAAAGVPGVHLGMHPDNLRALKFYQSLGFTELTRMHGVLYLAQRLS